MGRDLRQARYRYVGSGERASGSGLAHRRSTGWTTRKWIKKCFSVFRRGVRLRRCSLRPIRLLPRACCSSAVLSGGFHVGRGLTGFSTIWNYSGAVVVRCVCLRSHAKATRLCKTGGAGGSGLARASPLPPTRAYEQLDRHHGYSPDYPCVYARYPSHRRFGCKGGVWAFSRRAHHWRAVFGATWCRNFPTFGENAMEIADVIGEFLTGVKAPVISDTLLATVLFTDVVGSTEKEVALGDALARSARQSSRFCLSKHREFSRARNMTTGDGFFAAFDGPARAVRCACAIVDEIRPLGIEVRAGLHTGEERSRATTLAARCSHRRSRCIACWS